MSGFLIDTNVIVELMKSHSEERVVKWLDETNEDLMHVSVLTLGEIRKGAARVAPSHRRVAIEAWLETDLRNRFAGRVLPVTNEVADRWGWLDAQCEAKGFRLPVIDGLLAATALHHNLTFVTRNTKDVMATGVDLFNPWKNE